MSDVSGHLFFLSPNQPCQGVTDHLSEGSFCRNVVVQIPKFDAKPNSNPNPNPNPSPNPNPMPIRFGQVNCYRVKALNEHMLLK